LENQPESKPPKVAQASESHSPVQQLRSPVRFKNFAFPRPTTTGLPMSENINPDNRPPQQKQQQSLSSHKSLPENMRGKGREKIVKNNASTPTLPKHVLQTPSLSLAEACNKDLPLPSKSDLEVDDSADEGNEGYMSWENTDPLLDQDDDRLLVDGTTGLLRKRSSLILARLQNASESIHSTTSWLKKRLSSEHLHTQNYKAHKFKDGMDDAHGRLERVGEDSFAAEGAVVSNGSEEHWERETSLAYLRDSL
jgi:hypothetical protein